MRSGKPREAPEKKRVRMRLMHISSTGAELEEVEDGLERRVNIQRGSLAESVPPETKLEPENEPAPGTGGDQAAPWGLSVALPASWRGAGFILGSWMLSSYPVGLLLVVILGPLPWIHILSKKRRRMQKFERQLPEALDLMARSLKAGHAFTGGLQMVADEMEDPIGTEFDKTLGEINLGLDVQTAMKNLPLRVECPDLRFFVISVLIQRETGGNLAEILENIAYLIRERFKLHGRIRVLSAEGKFSAIVLVALPFLVVAALAFLNPDYLKILITDPIGNLMVGFAGVMIVLGILAMKKLVAIKV